MLDPLLGQLLAQSSELRLPLDLQHRLVHVIQIVVRAVRLRVHLVPRGP